MLAVRKREIRRKAEEFRSGCTIGKYGIRDLFEDCRRKGYKLFRYPLGDSGDMGFSMKKNQDIIIFTNSSYRLSREIFTLAHEIGHVLLHIDKMEAFVDNEHTISGCDEGIIEQEANFFAASLLLPKDEIEKFFELELPEYQQGKLTAFDITCIMSEFKVSFEMVLNQLENLGLIDEKEKLCLNTEKNISRVGNLLNATGGDYRLNVVSNEKALPFEYLEYVIYNYNHGAIPKETLMHALNCYGISYEDVSDKIVEPSIKEPDLDEVLGGL